MDNGIMKHSTETDLCDGCGRTLPVTEIGGNELCEECQKLAEALNKDPARTAQIMKLTHFSPSGDHLAPSPFQQGNGDDSILPEVLDAVRYRTKDRDANTWYISVSEIQGKPVEIFASTAFDRDHHLQSRISNITTITRLISLILRHIFLGEVITLEKTIRQIHRSSRQKNDMADMLTTVLKKYPHKSKQP